MRAIKYLLEEYLKNKDPSNPMDRLNARLLVLKLEEELNYLANGEK